MFGASAYTVLIFKKLLSMQSSQLCNNSKHILISLRTNTISAFWMTQQIMEARGAGEDTKHVISW
jgi:hypothetical protein